MTGRRSSSSNFVKDLNCHSLFYTYPTVNANHLAGLAQFQLRTFNPVLAVSYIKPSKPKMSRRRASRECSDLYTKISRYLV